MQISLRKQPEIHTYHLGEDELKNVEEAKDLGILVDSNLQFKNHLSAKANKANQVWGTIKRTFKHMNTYIFKKLFCAHVRSQLEYAVQVWSPHYRKDINTIESVQRRATKYIPGYEELSYTERLKRLDLPTLHYRRLRESMIEVYKMFSTYDKEVTFKFDTRETTTRGHKYKIFGTTAKRYHPKHHSFHHRIINPWNSLPEDVVNSPTLDTFRALASQFFSLNLLFPEALSLAEALFQICIIYQYNSFPIISHHNIFPFIKNNFRRIRKPLKRD